MKYFIQEWKFFNEQLLMAQAGDRNSMLCGLNQMFCDLVIKKAISILAAPDVEAFNTPLEMLCGGTYADRYYAMVGIEEPFDIDTANAIYKIELACMPTDGMPAHYVLAIPKQDFDYFLARMMIYINPDMLALVDWYDKQAEQKEIKMSLTFDNLIAIHELLFSETNLEQQLAKYEEEHQEYKEAPYATEESLYELADMVIVSAGVARFDYARGIGLLTETIYAAEFPIDGIWQAVEKKTCVNMTKRNWDKDPMVGYKHKDK